MSQQMQFTREHSQLTETRLSNKAVERQMNQYVEYPSGCALMKMRAVGITCISLALTTAVIGNAYYHKKQFYPSVVYITKSNPSMVVIYLQAFILVFLMGKLMRKVFFGQLRAAEFEHLMERSWYAVTETCLAFTVFRDDFSPKFVALFTVLLFLKSFHWLAEDRVDFMERSPIISWLFHIRVLSLLALLGILDLVFITYAYQSTVTKGASVQLVFGFEYAILVTIILNIAIKYGLHTIDLYNENPWDNKTVFLLYTELVMGFIKACLYITFFILMVRLYTLPLFALRQMYYTMRKFKQAYNDVILSRRAIQNMNTLYPDATPEELAAADNVCIICREEMTSASKKLPCNHIFHTSCLRSWFQRQQTCPTCRLNILRSPSARPAPPQNQQPAPGFPFQGLNGAIFGQPPVPPPMAQQVFPPFGAPGNFPFWQQAAPPAQGQPQQQQQQQTPQSQQPQQPQQAQQPQAQAQQAQPGQEGAQARPVPGTSTSRNENQQNPTDPNQRQPPFGSVFPPFFCPPPFFGMFPPPPMPPTDFTGLSDEELRRMEGGARENIEARLQCLRQIELLLDASVTLMQQYMAIVAATNIYNTSRRETSPQSTSSATGEGSAAGSSNAEAKKNSSSVNKTSEAKSSAPGRSDSCKIKDESSSAQSKESNDASAVSNEQKDIRGLRLKKFDNDVNAAD